MNTETQDEGRATKVEGQSKTTVIYHSADFDGLFCREIARKFLGNDNVDYIGWDYGNAKIPFPPEGMVYVLDLSPELFSDDSGEDLMPYDPARLIWIDHHKTAIDKFDGQDDPEANLKMHPRLPGYRIDGVAACRLAWQWFLKAFREARGMVWLLPTKNQFIERIVQEPMAVRLAGEYDIWDKRDANVDVFQMGLRSKALTEEDWEYLLTPHEEARGEYERGMLNVTIAKLLRDGKLLQDYANRRDADIVHALGFVVEFEGLKFLALNSSTKGSWQFAAKDVPETGHEALLKFNWTGELWDVSLYHAKHRPELDLSTIAQKHGGGGHRGACGFRTSWLPFLDLDAKAAA
jgi:oligoribonuclease NrnB/cAMP/cGMP phosphodiesterase (DHH superfamily)